MTIIARTAAARTTALSPLRDRLPLHDTLDIITLPTTPGQELDRLRGDRARSVPVNRSDAMRDARKGTRSLDTSGTVAPEFRKDFPTFRLLAQLDPRDAAPGSKRRT